MKNLTIDKNFPTRLRTLIKEKLKITQSDFCKKHNITNGYLSMILSGKRGPSANLIVDLFFHYSEYAVWLFAGEENQTALQYGGQDSVAAHNLSTHFQQQHLAWKINTDLLKLEKIDQKELLEIQYYIAYRLYRKECELKDKHPEVRELDGTG